MHSNLKADNVVPVVLGFNYEVIHLSPTNSTPPSLRSRIVLNQQNDNTERSYCDLNMSAITASDRGFPEWHHLPQILRFRKIPVMS